MRPIRRPRPRGGGGSTWQIIYMDLMTIMMVYFVILWSAETSSKKKDSEFTGISPTIGDQTGTSKAGRCNGIPLSETGRPPVASRRRLPDRCRPSSRSGASPTGAAVERRCFEHPQRSVPEDGPGIAQQLPEPGHGFRAGVEPHQPVRNTVRGQDFGRGAWLNRCGAHRIFGQVEPDTGGGCPGRTGMAVPGIRRRRCWWR